MGDGGFCSSSNSCSVWPTPPISTVCNGAPAAFPSRLDFFHFSSAAWSLCNLGFLGGRITLLTRVLGICRFGSESIL